MTQNWIILAKPSGAVLESMATAGPDVHPRDAGWSYTDDGAEAVAVTRQYDAAVDIFDPASRTLVQSLDVLRSRKWDEVKAQAAIAESWGCATASGRVQTDADSRGKITGMVVMAMLAQASGQAFDQQFTMADNSAVTIDAGGMIAIGLAAGAHVVACHAVAQAKRAEIDAAADAAAIAAVDLTGGWPDAPTG